jgi:hypothetical protein
MAPVSPLPSLFKEQLEAECTKLSEDHNLEERGHSLLYWDFKRLHDFSDSEIEEVFCDGGGDLGIDALWIDDDEIVHFYQFKNPQRIEKGIPTPARSGFSFYGVPPKIDQPILLVSSSSATRPR